MGQFSDLKVAAPSQVLPHKCSLTNACEGRFLGACTILGMALVDVDAVWKSYPRRAGLRTELKHVVEDVSLAIEAGETLGWWASRVVARLRWRG